jgi:hypothetical protein
MAKLTLTIPSRNPIEQARKPKKNNLLSWEAYPIAGATNTQCVKNNTIITTFNDLFFEDHWHYLDVAFLNHLWDEEWDLSKIFPLPEETSKTRKKDISTNDVVKILAFYRCLDPGSYLSAVDWFYTTACDLILGIDGTHFNESRIYRELHA